MLNINENNAKMQPSNIFILFFLQTLGPRPNKQSKYKTKEVKIFWASWVNKDVIVIDDQYLHEKNGCSISKFNITI